VCVVRNLFPITHVQNRLSVSPKFTCQARFFLKGTPHMATASPLHTEDQGKATGLGVPQPTIMDTHLTPHLPFFISITAAVFLALFFYGPDNQIAVHSRRPLHPLPHHWFTYIPTSSLHHHHVISLSIYLSIYLFVAPVRSADQNYNASTN
jgi:hypothetical protein